MLYFTEAGLSFLEVPDEISLCIYISGCQNNCPHCHYPALKSPEYGYPLKDNFISLIELYGSQISCVCFLGEGRNTPLEHEEFFYFTEQVRTFNLKTCLYSGRDIFPEEWMKIFDYVKVGSYRAEAGDLFCSETNQRFYLNQEGIFTDITEKFWHVTRNKL